VVQPRVIWTTDRNEGELAMEPTATDPQVTERRDAFVGRLFEAVNATFDIFSVYIGLRLGLYRALVATGPSTSAELAASTGTAERHIREWLEQQAVTGVLEVDDASAAGLARRYSLPAGFDEVLLGRDSPSYFAPIVRMIVGSTRPLAALLEAFRTGGGVPYAEYGEDIREGIADGNRPMFVNLMGSAWLATIPDVHARLSAEPGARVADIGCGSGWSSLAIATAYPRTHVDGFDLDEASIELARENAAAERLSDRVTFMLRDASDPALGGQYDLVTAFETLHDMGRPVEALATMRRIVRPGGAVVIADERVGETFGALGDPTERFMYGFSVLHCLPAGLADTPSVGTGTVLRPPTLRQYAAEAGFASVEILPIENDFWRFYRLIG
jgi:SAM-dependent methyltransferase